MTGVLRVLIAQVVIVALIGGFVSVCAHFFVAGIQYFENFRGQKTHLIEIFGFSINFWTAGLLIGAYILVLLVLSVGQNIFHYLSVALSFLQSSLPCAG